MSDQDLHLKILLVEDSPVQVKVLQHVIRDLPIFQLEHVAGDGDLALKYLKAEGEHSQRQLPDVILCDINMPRVSGFEVLDAVKADDTLSNVPFVMLTTSENEEEIVRAYSTGAHSFITKPIDLHGLEQVLAHFAHYWQAAKFSSQQKVQRLSEIPADLLLSRPDDVRRQLEPKSVNVLLVEDSLTQARLIQAAVDAVDEFRLVGHVTDGEQALAFLSRQPPYAGAERPHLILLDLNMPNLDGLQVLEQVKSHEEWRAIVVVVLTVRDQPQDIVQCYNLRANTFLTKPINADGMHAVLNRFCGYWADEAVKLPPASEH